MGESRTAWRLEVPCAGCGAAVPVEPDRRFVDCPYCGAASVLDLGVAATCFMLRPTLGEAEATERLALWMRERAIDGSEQTQPGITTCWVPFWVVGTGADDQALLAAEAADLPLPGSARRPAGQLEQLDSDSPPAGELLEPTVPLPAAMARLEPETDAVEVTKVSLVYAPFYRIAYSHEGLSYEAMIDASTGAVHASSWPASSAGGHDRRLGALFGLAVVAYVVAATALPGATMVVVAYALLTTLFVPLFGRALRKAEAGR